MASSSSPQADTCLNFVTHLLKAFIDTVIRVFSHEETSRKGEQVPQALPQSIESSSSSSPPMEHQVFLSFRGEDTRLNFTAHLLKALEDRGISVFFDEKGLEKGKESLSTALSRAIEYSKISLFVLSKDYASSDSCLDELSYTMNVRSIYSHGRIVIPIFYHVNPSHVGNFGGSFKASFEKHEKTRPVDQVKRWKTAFAKVSEIPGWHIKGGKVDTPETEYTEKMCWKYKKLRAGEGGILSLPDELTFLHWEYYPFRYLSSNFNPKNLLVLQLSHGDIEQLWNEDDFQGLGNLREIDLSHCKNLRKIPNLLGAIHLEILCCRGCESLVELPCLSHLSALKRLEFRGCRKLKKFPEIPNHFSLHCLEETGIEEVPDSIEQLVRLRKLCLRNSSVKNVSNNILKLEFHHCLDLSHCPITKFPKIPRNLKELYLSETQIEQVSLPFYSLSNLQYLDMSGSSVQRLQCNIDPSCSREISTIDVPSSILSLGYLKIDYCRSLKLLSELPPYLRYLNAHGCTSLEEVSFADQNQHLYEPRSFDCNDDFFMMFSICLSLTQDSIHNIVANAMLKIRSIAEKWARKCVYGPERLICCFPGTEIPPSKFEYQSMNSSLNLKIDPNRFSGSRYLVFSICLVADRMHASECGYFKCSISFTPAGGGRSCHHQDSGWFNELYFQKMHEYKGEHMVILFSSSMIRKGEGYEEASFKFYGDKVEKCGVHVSYVDAETVDEVYAIMEKKRMDDLISRK